MEIIRKGIARGLHSPTGERFENLYGLKKRLQLYAGKRPALYYGIYRLARKNPAQAVSPSTQLVIEGFPRSANTFAVVAFRRAQKEKVHVAHNLHVPAQVVRGAKWRIPILVLIRNPRDAVLSFVVRDPISIDQALRHYISFYETIAGYHGAYVLGRFEEVTEDYGRVIRRINEKFGTEFLPFSHSERAVERVFNRIDENYKRKFGGSSWEAKVSRPFAAREAMKREIESKLEDPNRKALIAEAENVYEYVIGRG